VRWMIGVDTWRADRGQFRLPGVPGRLPLGVEFALDLRDTSDAQLLVAATYNPFLGPRPGMRPTDLDDLYDDHATLDAVRDDARFDSLFVTTNRFRVARDGRQFAARGVNRGRLRYGRATGSGGGSTLADWFVDRAAGLVELRLPWNLLNVTDPSSRTVLARVTPTGPFGTQVTDGFRFELVGLGPDGRVVVGPSATPTFTWPTWEQPRWHERLKPAYAAMQSEWGSW
jgi:hypothetical protein